MTLTLAVGFGAINTGNNLIYLIFGMMLGFITASGVISEITLRSLEPDWISPARGHAGQPVVLRWILRNRKKRLPSLGLTLRTILATPRGLETHTAALLYVPPRGQRSCDMTFVPSRRGRYAVATLAIETLFPFGFFRKSVTLPLSAGFLIYPALHPVAVDVLRAAATERRRPLATRGLGDAFWAIRDYREGDNPRQMAWKASARQGRLMVRETEKNWDRRVVLRVGTPAWRSLSDPDLESAVSFAGSLALHKAREGLTVEIRAPGFARPRASMQENPGPFLAYLAEFDPAVHMESSGSMGAGRGESAWDVLDLWKKNRLPTISVKES